MNAGTRASSATWLPLSSQMRSVASCRFFTQRNPSKKRKKRGSRAFIGGCQGLPNIQQC
jgi:hypothetical protein